MKFVIVTIFIALSLAVVDFQGRLALDKTPLADNSNADAIANIQVSTLTDDQSQRFMKVLAQYDVKVKKATNAVTKQANKPINPVMPAEQQLKQSGQLKQLFDGDFKYTLRAIFNTGQRQYAVLEKHNLIKQETEQSLIAINEYLSIYQLSQISDTYVRFTHEQRQVELQLFPREA